MAKSVDDFRADLDASTLAIVDALRAVISGCHPGLTEQIKWNAPSFALAGEDRITLGLERTGGVRVVVHRGAAPKDIAGFSFHDVEGLAKWPAPDRGVIVFNDVAEVDAKRAALRAFFARWLAARA